ncbi:hypothetical protein G3I59_42955 [Amycolatopsis rubida]|uniref:Uncharacterized protein n=1 Tax=Amycolatopsis rubida TaxID=112413 RepID=A0ABX0CB09_9PSEU|nr:MULTISPECIES: hypothetical protein [Amycolatopsis]MYW97201.1 hypothetical protein [Amycolatopsis rubida]NEC62186.1 hypothetical protein [Amycolatopsis rubida]OAP24635.1 hypothetical protein A4R44_04604 [Amycolatopsis sp. M39]
MTTSNAEQPAHEGLDGPALRDALFAGKDVQPIRSVDEWAREDIFESVDELHEFRDWVAAERKANLA